MPWAEVLSLIGSGLQWDKTQEQYLAAINTARQRGREDVAQHLQIMLERRNLVLDESPIKNTPHGGGV